MRFVMHFTWIYLLIVGIDYSLGVRAPVSYQKNFRIYNLLMSTTPNNNMIGDKYKDLQKKCNFTCGSNERSTVVVQTAFDTWTGVNVPVDNDVMAIVYYNCTDDTYSSDPGAYEYHKFQKVCENRIEECKRYTDEYQSNWTSLYKGVTPLLPINFILSNERKSLKIQTEKCVSADKIIFTFKIDNTLINYRKERNTFNYEDKYFIASRLDKLDKSPIVLAINKFQDDKIADVAFHIQRRAVPPCSHNIINYCPSNCRNNKIIVEKKCFLKIDSKVMEIENIYNCSGRDLPEDLLNENPRTNGICQYFKSLNIVPCEHLCVDLPRCSYMCLKKERNKYIETGYQEDVFKLQYKKIVGSGQWSVDNIPSQMVYVDECVKASRLCMDPSSCQDKPKGYVCKYGDYTGKCKSLKISRFWHCPVADVRPPNMSSAWNSTVFIKRIDSIVNQSSNLQSRFYNLLDYIYETSDNYGKAPSFFSKSRRKDSYYAIDQIIKLMDKMRSQTINSSKPFYRAEDKSYLAYSASLNKTKKEYSIPLSKNVSEDGKQFVKLIFKDEAPGNSSENLTFFQFKNISQLNNFTELKSKTELTNINLPQQGETAPDNIVTGSDMIIVKLDQATNVSIQFRLNTIKNKIKSESWRFEYVETCAFVNEPSEELLWSEEGCRMVTSDGINFCECDHLSVFAMMFKFTMVNEAHMTAFIYLSFLGGIINCVALILFLIFVLFINSRDKLRLDQLNIAICLLVGTMVFLSGAYTSHNEFLCRGTALLSQFLFLSAFVWKLILGINVVRLIASLRYQNEDWMVKYRLAVLAVGYGVSLLIVLVFGLIYWKDYGKISDYVCWIDSRSNAFLSFLIPVGIILAVNIVVLFFIANTLIRNYINTRKTKFNESNELLVFFQLVISMGLTWVPSYFATVSLAAMYLLVIFFPLQGLMMFLFVVVINQENREKVSAFVVQRYSSLMSKSTLSTDTKSHTKSKSTNSKSTEQNQSLLSESEKDKEKEVKATNLPMVVLTDQDETTVPLHNPIC